MILGFVFALGTSLSWAFGNVFIQKSGQRLGGPRALIWALAVGGLLSAVAALALDERTAPFTAATVGWLLLAGVSGVIAYASIFYAFTHAKLSLAVPFVTLWSLVAGVFSLLVLGQRAQTSQLLGAAVVLAGVILVSIGAQRGKAAPDAPTTLAPLAIALLAGVAFGLMIPAMAEATPACGSFGTAAASYGIGLLVAVPVARVRGLALRPPPAGVRGLVFGAGLTETLGFVFLNAAGRLAPVALVAPVASLASVFTVLYAALFLRERPGALAFAGALVAGAGVVVLASSH
jgi:drug/metabolite transporter (DMT)-like permease